MISQRPFPTDHVFDGFEDQPYVEPDAPVLYVFRVEFYDLLKIGDVASAAHLPHAGDAGFERKSRSVMVLVFFPFVQGGRTGADNAHVALKDIPELGEFVQAVAADEFADAGDMSAVREDLVADDAGVKVQLEHHPVGNTVLRKEFLFPFIGIRVHGSDFIDLKLFAVLADAPLLVDKWAGTFFFYLWADNQHDQKRDKAAKNAAHNVNTALDEKLERTGIVGGGGDDIEAVYLFHKVLAAEAVDAQPDVDGDSHFSALPDEDSQRI